ESIPNYSGGLGILAGDHCKSASDLDLNFVAIGLLYRHGYFRQQIDKDGVQQAINLNQNFYHLPIREVRRGEAKLLISVPILDRNVFARVWELRVGRINVYLLDTDIPENSAEDRLITAELYGGDLEMRMRQEIVLGIGGVKALTALGIQPDVFHMNEGHSAFLALERIRLNVVQKHLGDWEEHLTEPEFWRGVIDIHDAQLWEAHQQLKRRLIEFVRDRERHRRERLGESPESIRKVNRVLDPEILTIGFARRFAT